MDGKYKKSNNLTFLTSSKACIKLSASTAPAWPLPEDGFGAAKAFRWDAGTLLLRDFKEVGPPFFLGA